MAFGRRCSLGCESWPDDDKYNSCEVCGEKTKRYRNLSPLDEDEANSRVQNIRFDAYYEKRCAERGIPVSGPFPPDYSPALSKSARKLLARL
jgi:hypothetical protein